MTSGYSFLIAGELMSGANQRANSPNQPLAVFCRLFDSLSAYADMKARPKRLDERFSPGEIMPQFQFPRRSRRFDLRNHTTIEVLQNFTGRSEELRSYRSNHTATTSTRRASEGAEIAYPAAVWGFFRLGMKSDLINLEKAHGDHLRRSSPGLLRAL
ncbi:hypothetical protein PGT21_000059 [Puccinia graminis f. sp. tritici]|uniref:Uncharacterized protein n=1 Tax=Puccinia graminis f. sp. tritici TaxID=56615 RepID=A0A5B0N9U7_PUCGR|nr:hypothetical protein PGT21_004985 [Puccinia graminis f. sp. tritici]KAA1098803.1 hypothetical protein PGT21_000059 [Puccinia graminis f. sp. tritici]